MSEEQNKYNAKIVCVAGAFLLAVFEMAVFILMISFLAWQYRERFNRYKLYLAVSFLLLIFLSLILDAYYLVPVSELKKLWWTLGNLISEGSIKTVVSFYLSSFMRMSFISHLFFFHVSLIIVLMFSVWKENRYTLESDLLEYRKKEMKKMPTSDSKTVIGYKNKREVSSNDSAKHFFICGTTGSGKTVLLSNYIESGFKKGYPMLIIDGKGDTGKDSILDMIQRFKGDRKLYTVNMTDPASSSPYNPFSGSSGTVVRDVLVNLTDWTEEHYKANTERYIQCLVDVMEALSIPLSFKSIKENFSPGVLTELSKKAYKEELISKDSHAMNLEIIKSCSSIAADASARFFKIAEGDMAQIFGSDEGIDIFQALSENACILLILNPLLYPEISKAVGRLILIDAKKAVSKLFNTEHRRCFFIMDEINTYASTVWLDLFNKSRSAKLTCFAAAQSLSDLDMAAGEHFREQIIENCNNYIIMRQNSSKNAEAWANILGTKESLNVTYQIGGEKGAMSTTGLGSVRKDRKFLYHPDDIKTLKTGEAIFMSKDDMIHHKIKVRKGF